MSAEAAKSAVFSRKIGIALFFALLIFPFYASGQRLPLKSYTIADGLIDNSIRRIFQDEKGFLWFAGREGVSRFDGYEFVNYGVRDGLPNQLVNDIAQDRQGRIWVAANDFGIARFTDANNAPENASEDAPPPKFVRIIVDDSRHGADKVNRLLIDSRDNLWCLTDNGVYRAPVADDPKFKLIKNYDRPITGMASRALFEDAAGSVWFAIHNELFEARTTHGGTEEIIKHGTVPASPTYLIRDAVRAESGKILVLEHKQGLFEFDPASGAWRNLTGAVKKTKFFYALLKDRDNAVYVGGDGGLIKLSNDGNLTEYADEQKLKSIDSLFQDREGNLWSGSSSAGVFKLSGNAIAGFPAPANHYSLGVSEHNGSIKIYSCAINRHGIWHCDAQSKDLPESQDSAAGAPWQSVARILPLGNNYHIYKRSELWGASYGESRALNITETNFQTPDGRAIDLGEFFEQPLKQSDDLVVYADEKNALWLGKDGGYIYRVAWNEKGERSIEKIPWEYQARPELLTSDRSGGLWAFRRGSRGGRIRNGQYQSFAALENLSYGAFCAFTDSRGWLWLGTLFDGVYVTKNPDAETPVFESYTIENGLLSNAVWAIAEDDRGRMYFGTNKGLSRFDPRAGVWNGFTSRDGLVGDSVNGLFRDSRGNIWINTREGVARLNPQMERPTTAPPPVFISHIKIAGREYRIAETGVVTALPAVLSAAQNNLAIDFVGLEFKNENALRYQYKLEGGGDENWSAPSKNRTITFASLAAGEYRFLARAVTEDGIVSAAPAQFEFKIYPPVYLRWWFIALAFAAAALVFYAFYRVRLQKLLEIERTRTLIATDLHDDIGSNLSKISVLSEVVRMQLERGGENVSDGRLLSSIAEISRSSVSSMSDIVWAINPKRDSVHEMIQKMREHAEEALLSKNVSVTFSEPDRSAKIKLPMDLRRDLYLIFKEAVNNISKHSGCTQVAIDLAVTRGQLVLRIEDDGCGFERDENSSGNGLNNIRMRVEKLKGTFELESAPKRGTRLIVRLPQH